MQIPNTIKKFGIEQAAYYLTKNPEKNVPRVMDWVDRLSGESFANQRRAVRAVIGDPENCYHEMMFRALSDLDPEVVKTFFVNFFLNANIISWQKQEEYREKYGCNIPWTILLDPTSACNLHCTGCWAAEYGNRLNLTFDEIDDIIRQGKEMGVYFYIYTGGEPLTRKADLIKICEKHGDCEFLCFTNGTLIDEAFADEMLRVKNFVPAISVEGFEAATDDRRGAGTYRKVVKTMEILRGRRLPFGASCCYTSRNIDSLTSEDYYDMLIAQGALFVWFFHYMPVGVDAVPELLCTPAQREHIYRAIRDYRSRKPIFAIDFQNDAEYVGGCIAGGRRYLHINANGDVDPCVFIHYSDSNIREKTLLEALASPLFMAYHDGQPFNENMLRPCPMLENPEKLPELVRRSGAHSTDLQAPESAEHLCEKCRRYAANWKPSAEALWSGGAGESKAPEAEKAEQATAAACGSG